MPSGRQNLKRIGEWEKPRKRTSRMPKGASQRSEQDNQRCEERRGRRKKRKRRE
jgi:hypothetical protein